MESETPGERLKRAMKRKGVDNSAVAEVAGRHSTTISQWRNDRQWPDDDSALEPVAKLLGVTVRWLRYGSEKEVVLNSTKGVEIGGSSTFSVVDLPPRQVSESAGEPYVPNSEYRNELPPRVYEALLGYLARLERLGLTHEQIARLETTLANTRYAQRFRRQGRTLTEDEQLELLDATWDAIAETLATQGARP